MTDGVEIPGKDGRACCVALRAADGPAGIDRDGLAKAVRDALPSYAVPMFIRFLPAMELTQTFKQKKVQYRKQGIDPRKIADAMWWFNPARKKYEDFDLGAYDAIVAGRAKL